MQQYRYSEVSLHKAIDLLFEARRLVAEQCHCEPAPGAATGLAEADFTSIYSNLLICYLRLYFDHGIKEGLAQAGLLAREICASKELGPAFLTECIREGADPELTNLLDKPEAGELASYLRQQACS